MPKQFQLKIADPCHEDWNKMTSSEKGKYCGSCQKQVIDFTGMTDTQLATFFKKSPTGSVCGRFFDDQLDRKISVPRKEIPWIKYFFQFTLPLFLASCTGNRTKGKVAVTTVQKESTTKDTVWTATVGMVLPRIEEEVKVTCTELVGEVGIEEIPDSTRSKELSPNKKEVGLNISPSGNESIDSGLNKTQIEGYRPIDFTFNHSFQLDQLKLDSIFCDSFTGTLGAVSFIPYGDNEELEVLTIPDSAPSFKMYANPARANSNVFIDAQKTEEGLYAIQLLNFSGQLIKQEQVRLGKGMGVITFPVPAIPSGNYLVVLLNKKTGKKTTEKLIVQ